jgi:MFS family permease
VWGAPRAGRAHSLTLVTVALSLACLGFSVMQSLLVPALPSLQRAFHASTETVTWTLTAFLLTASVATPISGRLGDMFGKTRVLLIVLVISSVGAVISALAPSLLMVTVGRAIQGVGYGVFPLSYSIVRDEFPPAKVPGNIGILSGILGVGGGVSILLSGVVVTYLSWHWLFWISAIELVAATLAVAAFVPESPIRTPGRINWRAAVLLSAALTVLMLDLSQAATWGWLSWQFVGLLAVATGLAAWWIRTEMRSPEPLIDVDLLRQRPMWSVNAATVSFGFGMFGAFVLIPQFVQTPKVAGFGFGASVLQSGLFVLPLPTTMLVVSLLSGRIARRFGFRLPVLWGACVCAVAYLLMALFHRHPYQILLEAILQGAGVGLAFAGLANLVVEGAPRDKTGMAGGMNTVMRSVGSALGAQITATVIAATVVAGLPRESGFTTAFLIMAGVTVVCFFVCLLIPKPARARELVAGPDGARTIAITRAASEA